MTDGKCGSVLGYESGKFKEERSDRHLLTSYHSWYVRGAAAYVSSRFSRTCIRQKAEAPRFRVCYSTLTDTNNIMNNNIITMKFNAPEDYRFLPVDLLKNHKCERSGVSARELDENINRLKSVLPDCKIEIAL